VFDLLCEITTLARALRENELISIYPLYHANLHVDLLF
jgi:hypothetical protein